MMSKEIRNVIKPNVFVEVEILLENQKIITPEILDDMQEKYYEFLKEQDYKIGRKGIREIIVEVILNNFSTQAFGVEPAAWTPGEITDKAIKKYKKQFLNN
jgi:hypothetical protein